MLDIGQDGTGIAANALFARDAAALMLQYYDGDYAPVAGTGTFNLFSADAVGLYNGNIAALSTATDSVTPLLKLFRYDKLNRIKRMQTAGVSGGEWTIPTDNFSTEYRYDYNGNILSLQRKDANAQIMHHINYAYNAKNNRLQGITATGINSSNYTYDAIGNLSNDSGENVGITWNAMNKVKQVNLPNNRQLQFSYSPTGQRQIKKSTDKTEYYLHDATGNIMCIYELNGNYLTVKERTIYGSKRIGVYRQQIRFGISSSFIQVPGTGLINILHPQPVISPDGRHYLEGSNRLQVIGANQRIVSNTTMPYSYKKGTEELKGFAPIMYSIPTFLDGAKTAGLRNYELTDHLSNVMAVISDRKLSVDTNNDNITDYYASQVVSFTDYYPFGFPIAERSGNLSGYRFGFNGQEGDGEIYGTKQSYTAEFWQYDTRLGRRWNMDPKGNVSASFYACFGNSPIMFNDVLGDTVRYNSFRERVDVLIARVLSKAFRKEFKELKKSEKVYVYNRIDREDVGETGESGNISVNEEFTYEKDDSHKMRNSNPNSFTINYSIISDDLYGRSPFHALFEETFHAVDFELERSSSMIGYSELNNSFFLGHNLFDRSHEARAWQFAAINAPFYRSCPKLLSAEGNEYYLLSSLVSQIRMLYNVDNQKNINYIIDLLYNQFTTMYRYVGEEKIREQTTYQLYH